MIGDSDRPKVTLLCEASPLWICPMEKSIGDSQNMMIKSLTRMGEDMNMTSPNVGRQNKERQIEYHHILPRLD